jgi:uncharacterized membrane protein
LGRAGVLAALVAFVAVTAWTSEAGAYDRWSQNRDATNCASCHGAFTAGGYTSDKDGTAWGTSLHDGHRFTMLNSDCNTCHQPPTGTPRFPVFLGISAGGNGLDPLGCVGCHGRNEDAGGDGISPGLGAGLRQHHNDAGITLCAGCHSDANPANFMTAGEDIPPPYYFTPDGAHAAKPTDACDANGTESVFSTLGLDNDGDLLDDSADPDCQVPDINRNPAALDFGVVALGDASTLTTQIENLGNADLTVTGIAPGAGTSAEFSFTAPATPFTVPAGGSQAVQVTYAPVDVGLDTGSLEIASDDPDEPSVAVALSGSSEGAGTPDINLAPRALNFGTVFVGSDSTLNVDIQNLGNADLTVSGIDFCLGTSTEYDFTSDPVPITVPPGGSRMLSVTYTPINEGGDRGCLEIGSDDPDEASVFVDLLAFGAAAAGPDINLNPAALDFGVVFIGDTATLTTQVENVGNADLMVTGIAPGAGTSAEYGFTAPATPFTVPVGGTQAVQVTYAPVDVGLDAGSLEISSDDPDEPTVSVALSGTGDVVTAPDINLNPLALDFGTVAVGGSGTLTTLVENLGTASLNVTAVDLCVGTSTEFGFAPLASTTIAPGASESLSVTYTPVDAGTDTGCIAISSNDLDEPVVELALSGTGEALEPDINLSPLALDFGTVFIGDTATLTTQIENLGNTDLTVTDIVPGAGTSGEYSFTAPATPFAVPPGGSQVVEVTYAPVDPDGDTGSLEITSDDPDEPVVELGLTGTGIDRSEPDINLNPVALDLGTIFVGSSSTLTADIQNLGTANLTVTLIDLCLGTSTEFGFTSDPVPITIPSGGSRALSVTYAPADVGTDTGCIAISSNDPDEPVVELGLAGSGEALEPDINLNPVALDFGTVFIGDTATLTTQVENVGNADLTVADIVPGAGTSPEYSFTPTSFTLPPGGSQVVDVTYAPVDLGPDTGSLEITSDDPDEPTVTLDLAGTGAAVPTPDINLDPVALDFGTVVIGSSPTLPADIQNLGTADLEVALIDLCVGTSTEFGLTADPTPFVIPPGGSRALSVTYAPVDAGTDTGCLEVQSDDPDEPVVELGLMGTGVEQPAFIEVNVKVPGAINPQNQGVTPFKFSADMDLEIVEAFCGPNQAEQVRLNVEDVNDDGFMDVVGLFKTRELGIQCGDRTLMCEGTLADGTAFQGTSNPFRTDGRACKNDNHDNQGRRGRR